jgi:hypothetical protein
VVGLEHTTQSPYTTFVGLNGARDATNHLIADVVQSRQPIAVIVDHGLHTVLVAGVYSTGDPVSNPGSVVSLVVWDPGNPSSASNIQSMTKATVSLSTWLNNSIYWGQPYASNSILGGKIVLDPDPAVSPYTYDPNKNDFVHLWIGHYVYIRPQGANMDWAFEGSGKLIKGWHGEVPSDYSGPTTTLANKLTLPETTVDAPGFWTRDTGAASLTGPASVLAWAGSDSAHHIYIATSADGFRYSNKVVLPDTSTHRPSVIVVQNSGKSIVAVAWIDTTSAHSLHLIYDVYQVLNAKALRTALPYANASPPTLAEFGGQIWLAWAGADAQHSINILPMGPNGQSPGTVTTLAGASTTTTPKLVADTGTNQLLVVWQDVSSMKLNLAQSADGTTWTMLPATSQSSNSGPTMIAIDTPPDGMSAYQWVWTSTSSSRNINLMQGTSLTDWQPALALRESSPSAPSLGYVGQPHEVLIVWRGGDSAHHLSVASIPV